MSKEKQDLKEKILEQALEAEKLIARISEVINNTKDQCSVAEKLKTPLNWGDFGSAARLTISLREIVETFPE